MQEAASAPAEATETSPAVGVGDESATSAVTGGDVADKDTVKEKEKEKSRTCGNCAAPNAAVRCSRCKAAYYCDASCQKKAYPAHKQRCYPPGTTVPDKDTEKERKEKEKARTCGNCAPPNAAVRCSRCKAAWYCDAGCQKKAYSSHKHDCVTPEVAAERAKNRALAAKHREREAEAERALEERRSQKTQPKYPKQPEYDEFCRLSQEKEDGYETSDLSDDEEAKARKKKHKEKRLGLMDSIQVRVSVRVSVRDWDSWTRSK